MIEIELINNTFIFRRGLHEVGHGNHGRIGLVLGPIGDYPDASICIRYGVIKGKQ